MRTLMIFCTAISLLGTASGADRLKQPALPNHPPGMEAKLPGGDIEAIAFLVLMEAAKSAQEDVRAVMASVKAINATKQKLREDLQAAQKLAAGRGDPCDGKTVVSWRECLKAVRASTARMEIAALDMSKGALSDARVLVGWMVWSMQWTQEKKLRRVVQTYGGKPHPCGMPDVRDWKACLGVVHARIVLHAPDKASLRELEEAIAAAKAELDSMSEMGEVESLRLQMAMDRMSKLMSTLSNVLKKISETANQITQNLK